MHKKMGGRMLAVAALAEACASSMRRWMPEPASYAPMLAGVAAIGVAARRRRAA